MLSFLECTDFYKTGHVRQMAPGTTRILENWTPRAGRDPSQSGAVFFGLQGHLHYDLGELAERTFFQRRLKDVLYEYQELTDTALGQGAVTTEHIAALHKLKYIPLEYCALPEGTFTPYKIPMFTTENTHDDFAWVGGYLETFGSSRVWQACTTASTARINRRILSAWCDRTGGDPSIVPFQGHDFSFRGMPGPEAAAFSGAGHLLSFCGTDTIPAIRFLREAYDADSRNEIIGCSVPATEHMVMCLGSKETEIETFRRLLKLYPTGIISVVSDTWDLWKVITEILPQLKEEIMARDGKLVIRPDSGDPVKILCGDEGLDRWLPAYKGVIELLYEIFGGTTTPTGHRVLDSHIGAIYGDSINTPRTSAICERLDEKNFASTNAILGYGSYSYQYVTRDTHGFAVKATWAKVNGREVELFKDPITDPGTKKSARGRLGVVKTATSLELVDRMNSQEHRLMREAGMDMLEPVWRNGMFIKRNSLSGMRTRILA